MSAAADRWADAHPAAARGVAEGLSCPILRVVLDARALGGPDIPLDRLAALLSAVVPT
jgi:hypothetical protein